jgi:hypothetical protein
MRVQCPKCKRKNTYTTTDKYNPDIMPHGGMVTLRNPKHKGGMTFGTVKGTSSIGAAFMECCDCAGKLVVGNRLIVLPEELPLPVDPVKARNQAVIDAEFESEDEETVEVIHKMPAIDSPLTCPHCGKECKSLAGLTSHMRNSHGEK